MRELTRERIKALRWGDVAWSSEDVDAICTMALRALDTGWQPMSTAPRDGSDFIAAVRGRSVIIHWRGYWRDVDGHEEAIPDAWMPLPPPFTGDAKVLATEPGECSGYVSGLDCLCLGYVSNCRICNGTGKRKGGEHG